MARLHDAVMRALASEIVAGVHPPGDKLPREADLAAQFEVSRGVVREAARALEERGLIVVKQGKGATVNDPAHWDAFDPDVVDLMLDSEHGQDVIGHFLECQRLLEVEAAALAAARASNHDIEAMAATLAPMEAAAERPPTSITEKRFDEADLAFHKAIASATGNRALAGLLNPIHDRRME